MLQHKSHQLPYSNHFEKAKFPLGCLHLDLVGPISPASLSGCSYFLTIVYQATVFKIIEFLKRKSEAFQHFLSEKRLMENKHNRKLKKLVSNQGETPQHNGYAEQENRTILEKARCLINPTNLPKSFWAEAINTSVFLSNLSTTISHNNKFPHLLWYNNPGRINRLKSFGCRAVIFNHHKHRDWKLAPPGSEGIFLGYENKNTSYRILRIHDSKIIITRNATFNKKIYPRINSSSDTLQEDTKWSFLKNITEPINEDSNKQLSGEYSEIEGFPLPENLMISEMVDEAHSDELNASSTEIDNQPRIKVTQSEERITLDQQHFSKALLNLYGMSKCKEATTLLVLNKHLGPATNEEITSFKKMRINFRSAIGSLKYLSTATRPDLAHAVSALSQYLENSGIWPWKGFLHVLRYLKGLQEHHHHHIHCSYLLNTLPL
ncbi:hypothetical protein O181_004888 [Austropuccinia psidii MF-1]|uniref:Retroviral polymerase SH3-like domain-containing protein n=1 Tax=Austropuccinia psidii MF-1 TaxID=1389203 RepID=A0A9Q3GF07_9BASI|nr:hypothetical protein [Austropuccinia psidii MF-1]